MVHGRNKRRNGADHFISAIVTEPDRTELRTESHLVLRQYNPAKDFKIERALVKSVHLIVGTLRVAT